MTEIQKIPFVRLLLPLLFGIVFQYNCSTSTIWSITMIFLGLFVMLLSFFISASNTYRYRWLFGLGVYLILFSVGIFSTQIQQWQNVFPFSEAHEVYEGTIIEIPVQKPNTVQLTLELKDYDRKIMAYVSKDTFSLNLRVGQRLIFFSKIEPIQQVGTIGHFTYSRYLYNKGYCATVYIPSDRWEVIDEGLYSISILAAKCRKAIIDYYRSLDLTDQQLALISGLTLGYTTDFPQDLLQSFRITGTAHMLAVSGLHIGIVYLVFMLMLSSITSMRVKQGIVLLLLWTYIFVVGLPLSAVRAGIMLSFYSVGCVLGMRAYTLNTIGAAAFFILLFRPFSLFDLGFQLSFIAVLSLYLYLPIFKSLFQPKNRFIATAYNVVVVSLAAQIGIMPLCLYYFGTFPVYFLLANLLLVPLLSIVFYIILALVVSSLIDLLILSSISFFSVIPVYLFKICTRWMVEVVTWISDFPIAEIQSIDISLLELFVLLALVFSVSIYIQIRSARWLISILSIIFVFMTIQVCYLFTNRNTLTLINDREASLIQLQIGYYKTNMTPVDQNQVLDLNTQILYILAANVWHNKQSSNEKMTVDYLFLETTDLLSIESLNDVFEIKRVIFGNSIPRASVRRLTSECEKLRIPYYDLYLNGNLTIYF